MSKLDVVEIWKELHRMPEPGMNEFKTGAYLADALEKLGYEVTRGVGKTGVVGVVRGKEPGPVVMLRADMDALPFKNEDGSIEYVHACGHDSHSAMLPNSWTKSKKARSRSCFSQPKKRSKGRSP